MRLESSSSYSAPPTLASPTVISLTKATMVDTSYSGACSTQSSPAALRTAQSADSNSLGGQVEGFILSISRNIEVLGIITC